MMNLLLLLMPMNPRIDVRNMMTPVKIKLAWKRESFPPLPWAFSSIMRYRP